jgi:hypothetical protein
MAEIKIGDEVVLVEPFKVFRLLKDGRLDICDSEGNCISVNSNQVKLKTTDMKAMKDACLTVATSLAKANNTVTTLEIKTELRRDYPYFFWTQDTVSKFMDQLAGDGVFTYTDNGTYRTYSLVGSPVVKPVTPRPKKTITKNVVAGSGTANTVQNTGIKAQAKKVDWPDVLRFAQNPTFKSVTLINGKTLDKDAIKGQKKSPLGYISPKIGRIASIVVGSTQYNVK